MNLAYALPPPCSEKELLETSDWAIEGYVVNVKCGGAYDSGECRPFPEDMKFTRVDEEGNMIEVPRPEFKPELVSDCIATIRVTKVLKGDYNVGDEVKISFVKLIQQCEGGQHIPPGSPKKNFRLNSKIRYYNTNQLPCAYWNFEEIEEPAGSETVSFPDGNLEVAVRDALGKPLGEEILAAELAKLTTLHAESKRIANLSGLEYCTNLIVLDLADNQISDISPLSSLTNLTELSLALNQISDTTPLANLTGLIWLCLNGNQISDLSPLSSLTSLTELYLPQNQISDISPLSNLTDLNKLFLEYNQISDIAPLSSLTSLTELELEHNQISDITPLSSLMSLTELFLRQNQIIDISPLSNLANLNKLFLGYNQISDITPVSSLTSLTYLGLGTNQIRDISPLSGLTGLENLNLSDNQISDISALVENAGLSNGDTLDLYGTPLSNTSLNEYIPQLEQRGVNVSWSPILPPIPTPTPAPVAAAGIDWWVWLIISLIVTGALVVIVRRLRRHPA